MSARPRLSPHAQIMPAAAGWLVRHRRDTVLLASPMADLPAGPLLDQLDGSHDLAALTGTTGLTMQELSALIGQMAHLDLFDAARETLGDAAGDFADVASLGTELRIAPLRVLVVGLGALGLRVAAELMRLPGTRLVLFDLAHCGSHASAPDDSETTPRDVDHLLERAGDAVCLVRAAASTRAAIEAALRPLLADVQAVICAADQPTAFVGTLAKLCRQTQVPLVFGQLTEEGGRVGPALVGERSAPGAGCPICAEYHEADRDLFAAALPAFLAARWPRPAPWRYPHRLTDVTIVARLLVLSLCKALETSCGMRPADALAMLVDFDSRTVHVESVARHPRCRICFPALEPSTAAAPDDARSRWISSRSPGPVSPADPRAMLPQLRALTGMHFGLFDTTLPRPPRERHAVWQFFRERGVNPQGSRLANAHAVQVLRREAGSERVLNHFSGAFDFEDADRAEALALIEGLERLFALSFRPSERIVQARYADIVADAIDPRSFPLYADEQYAEPGFPLQRFDPDASIPWVWAVDLTAAGSPVLVPADLVFGSRSAARIFRANSSGAACHSSPPHAVINGIYETVERDALMLAWLNRMSLPRVLLGDADVDPWSLRRTLKDLDFELQHVDISTDLDIPVLLAVLRDRRNPSMFLLNMVSQLDPQAQLSKLYRELAQFLFPYLIDRDHFVRDCTRDPDPNRVVDFPDHLAFYQTAERNRHASFLTSAATSRPFSLAGRTGQSLDAPAELQLLVSRLAAKGYRTIVVDCTLPLLRDLGLCAVKVLVPGLQPLNCGHQLRPLGGERVVTVARSMGLAPGRRHLAELNPWPHPFW